MKKMLAFAVGVFSALLFAQDAFAQWSGTGGCPGATRSGLPPCCATFTPPSGGSDDDRTCVGPATSYQMTIYEFNFEDTGGNLVRLGSEQTFDAAAVNAGETVGSFLTGAILPAGTYPYLRPVISRNYTVAGNITTADSRSCTGTATGIPVGDESLETCDANGINPNYSMGGGHENCVSTDGKMHIRDGQTTFNVADGDSLNFNFNFYVESGVKCVFPAGGTGDATMGVGALFVTVTQ